ncbi:hypothetical protein Y032_0258g448 [Ancylostoma ceylanicum]|uniref:Uncharacterized protein n=1 Tax=Ancylostoma ceylanicum TaxID=53326 RepID=A0A016SBF6_9BILA|nr:hypothetical protein Y032_0258g448 [Ancylostoma ceylanicum]
MFSKGKRHGDSRSRKEIRDSIETFVSPTYSLCHRHKRYATHPDSSEVKIQLSGNFVRTLTGGERGGEDGPTAITGAAASVKKGTAWRAMLPAEMGMRIT